ncbi:MAG: DNA-processing protein DprA, partial [Planctomycetota bacterium]
REHLALSQFAPGSVTNRASFPARNRTMALISDATVIVEAGEKSGTMHQGWEAIRLGRALFILESLAREGFEWVTKLQEHGAQVLSDENCERFIESLPEESRLERFAEAPF